MTLTDPVNSASNDPAHTGGKIKLVSHVNAIDPVGLSRAVGQRHRPQADLRQRHRRPEVGALHEGRLVLEGEALEQRSQVVGGGGHAVIPSVVDVAEAATSGRSVAAASVGRRRWAAMKSRYQYALSLGMRVWVG